jgi:hypothetical protein
VVRGRLHAARGVPLGRRRTTLFGGKALRLLVAVSAILLPQTACGSVDEAPDAGPSDGGPSGGVPSGGGPTGVDSCQDLVRDRTHRPLAPLPPPAAGGFVVDPAFQTRIRRVTAVSPREGENAIIKPVYGTVQAWNADESKLVLWHRGQGHELYDGRTYRFLRRLELVSPTDIEQILWDPVDPDVLYYPSNYNATPNLMRYRVSTASSEVLFRVPFCPVDWGRVLSLGADPMYLSWEADSKVIGLMCGDEKFLYDVARGQVVGRATIVSRNAPQPGPSGQVAYLDGRVYDRSLRPLRTLALQNPFEHASIGRSATTRHDLFNTVVFDHLPGGNDLRDAGTLVSVDMSTGERRVIIGMATGYPYPPSGTHISSIAHRNPGWVAVSVVGDPRVPGILHNELLIANVDSGLVCRVAHHRSYAGEGRWGYWAEPHVVLSPTGTRLLFGSDWGNGASVDSYVVELPAYRAP